ncbi:MAG TPA: FCSD flavin-binding domain-containing protein [Thiobacillaceae bacterium]|nr:FCSD flavin-binding domain-containing protein [Thiobacillaceae bacterium]HNU63077.1 FCSD flavin-binding domain-containing protein [Thiobacillaceae bacterium]
MSMNRRDFLLTAGALSLGRPALARTSAARPRVIVVGAGFGGASCARFLKEWEPQVEVTLIEPRPQFISCPMSNTVIAGMNRLEDITLPYDYLKRRVDHFVADRVTDIDVGKRTVTTAQGLSLAYDRLVLSPGVELMFDKVEGYDATAQETVKHAMQAGPEQTGVLRRQLEDMPDGGVFVIAIPMAPFRCPPAPYERISLVAQYLKRHKPRSKVIVLDANGDLVSKKALFTTAWKKYYGYGTDDSLIEYRPDNRVIGLDVAEMEVRTEFDEAHGDVINLIPPMGAGALTARIGARTGDNGMWCPVDFLSFESLEAPNVHILGDAMLANLSKAAALANTSGKLCAWALGEIFAGRQPDPEPVLSSTCYSLGSDQAAFNVATVFRYNPKSKLLEVQEGSNGVSDHESAEELKYLRGWAHNIWIDTLALPRDYPFTNRF